MELELNGEFHFDCFMSCLSDAHIFVWEDRTVCVSVCLRSELVCILHVNVPGLFTIQQQSSYSSTLFYFIYDFTQPNYLNISPTFHTCRQLHRSNSVFE